MIFISVGTQKFQFNRLLKDIDELIDSGYIKEDVFAQIGHSNYLPKNYDYTKFLNHHDFHELINNCSIYITHGGVGSIQNGLRLNKTIIVFPRLSKFGEHVDDHQIEIAQKFTEMGFVLHAENKDQLLQEIKRAKSFTGLYLNSENRSKIESYIDKFIEGK